MLITYFQNRITQIFPWQIALLAWGLLFFSSIRRRDLGVKVFG